MSKLSEKEICELTAHTKNIRENILKMINKANSGHTGGSLSATDLMTVLYFKVLKHFNSWDKDPNFKKRDRFILSKGHCAPALYATLAECGYYEAQETLTLRQLGSKFQGHPSYGCLPGIEVTTGSLGQGLSLANGIALGLKLDKKDSRVYVMLGDGELQEGQVWEAIMTSSHYKIDNLIAVVDRNRLQIDGNTEKVMSLGNVADKFKSFGWQVVEIDGHDLRQIYEAFETAKKLGKTNHAPVAIVANTIKGKGISFMENNAGWHGVAPNDEELALALKELRG